MHTNVRLSRDQVILIENDYYFSIFTLMVMIVIYITV